VVFKRRPGAAATTEKPANKRTAKKERAFLREVEGAPNYELARPVRVTIRLSEEEAERLRKRCFDDKATTQGFFVTLLAREGICDE